MGTDGTAGGGGGGTDGGGTADDAVDYMQDLDLQASSGDTDAAGRRAAGTGVQYTTVQAGGGTPAGDGGGSHAKAAVPDYASPTEDVPDYAAARFGMIVLPPPHTHTHVRARATAPPSFTRGPHAHVWLRARGHVALCVCLCGAPWL